MVLFLVRDVSRNCGKVTWGDGDSAISTLPLEELTIGEQGVRGEVGGCALYLANHLGD